MNSRTKRITSALALLLIFSISQVYVGYSFAAPEDPTVVSGPPAPQMQDPAGILTTIGNKPITVNGTTAITGTTILSGASIETPDGVGATVSLDTQGSLEIAPKAKLNLTFHTDGIKVMLLEGCVTLRAKKGVTGEIETSKGPVSKTDPKEGGVLRVCHPDSVLIAAAAASGGLSKLAMLAIIGGQAAVVIPVIVPGSNPSNSSP